MSTQMKLGLLITALIALIFAGCSTPTDDDTFADRIVVNAFLIGGQPIDSVYIQKTGKVTELYTDNNAAVRNALVIITGHDVSDTLASDPLIPGRYFSKARGRVVRPGATYTLLVKVQGYGDITGATTVPDTFSVVNSRDFLPVVSYAPTKTPLNIAWSHNSQYADYMVVVRSLDLMSAMIPTNFHEEDNKPDRTAIGFFLHDVNACDISWLYFNYYGKTVITVVATDQNYFDYLKQAMAAQGASDLKEMRYNLNGAIGVFGSETVAKNTIEMNVTP